MIDQALIRRCVQTIIAKWT